jgi:hypothetical protein
MDMRKLALAAAAAATLAFTAPAFALDGTAAPRMQLAQADVTVKKTTTVRRDGVVRKKVVVRRGDSVRRKVVIRDRGHHHGWRHGQHHGKKVVIIKKRGHGKTVIKKKITNG